MASEESLKQEDEGVRPAAPARLCQDRGCSTAELGFLSCPHLHLVRLSTRIHAASEHPVVQRVWRESRTRQGGERASPSPPCLPPSPPSPGAGVQVKSLDFNGRIRLKSLNSARPHCAGVGGGGEVGWGHGRCCPPAGVSHRRCCGNVARPPAC